MLSGGNLSHRENSNIIKTNVLGTPNPKIGRGRSEMHNNEMQNTKFPRNNYSTDENVIR